MNFTIPIYVEERREPDSKRGTYFLRPLFFDQPTEHSRSISRAMSDLVKEIRRKLNRLAARASHEELVKWTYCPELELREVQVSVMPKKTGVHSRFPVVLIQMFDRQLGHIPSVRDVWFELNSSEDLTVKTEEVLRRKIREDEREREDSDVLDGQLTGKASISVIDVEVELPVVWKTEKLTGRGLRGGRRRLSGQDELESVGRCLDWDYPDGLQRALKRDKLVEEISALWKQSDRRSLMLVGPRKSGKTAILHECIFRRRSDPNLRLRYYVNETTWHIEPQRLIAGMSYVGQWEERLIAILEWCKQHKLRLHIDDVLGLFQAGVSSDSNLCLADVMKPFLERRDVSVIAEITPEALRILKERDRSFADLFQILPVGETSEIDTLLICIAQRRELEDRNACKFAVEAIPLIIDLKRRYVRDAAFPGKAVQMMKHLASVRAERDIGREDVLNAFQRSSGLSLEFLNDRMRLSRWDIVAGIRKGLVGQSEAVEAAADVICVAKARLNEIGKPLGCFLFLGPTGVGKTQCAKAIAAYLFSDSERMIRVDLNEYIGADAVGRLVGTFHNPEGILTSAIRRQPFSVVLLDEVEKANSEVHDLLLQVLGEARLTDALGRTADFSNAIVILTSNLGASETNRSVGFGQTGEQIALSFRRAAEKFFRPEFFNRIDRVIPFGTLALDEIRLISNALLQSLRDREGLKRWRCELRISAEATKVLINKGFDPRLGARALKRAVEREIAHPIGVHLSAMKPGNPGVIRVLASGDQLVVQSTELLFSEQRGVSEPVSEEDARTQVQELAQAVEKHARLLGKLGPHRTLKLSECSPKERAYYAIHEQLVRVRSLLAEAQDSLVQTKLDPDSLRIIPHRVAGRASPKLIASGMGSRRLELSNLLAEEAMKDFLKEVERQPNQGSLSETLETLLQEVGWLRVMTEAWEKSKVKEALIIVCGAGLKQIDTGTHERPAKKARSAKDAVSQYLGMLSEEAQLDPILILKAAVESCGLDCELADDGKLIEGPASLMDEERSALGLVLRGPGAIELAVSLAGTELTIRADNGMQLRQVIASEFPNNSSPAEFISMQLSEHAEWLSGSLMVDTGSLPRPDPLSFAPITTLTDLRTNVTMDLRSGRVFRNVKLTAEDIRGIALSQLVSKREWGGGT